MSQNLVTEEKVYEELKKAIVETLRVEEGSVTPESSLINDLGAESLDFLDINYRLEQSFGIKMARHFVLEHIEELFGEGSAIDEDGRLTGKAIELLKIRFGDSMADLEAGMDMDEIPAMVTVRSMADGVMDILASLPESCPKCGNSSWKSDDGSKVTCGSCRESATYTNGDDLIKAWLNKVQQEKNIF
ncbi:MAG: acyl carrier protein [Nitrospiraceae bacterium]|nr:MAG: acyl carrier protein [Nitrospiraceae bacterium]